MSTGSLFIQFNTNEFPFGAPSNDSNLPMKTWCRIFAAKLGIVPTGGVYLSSCGFKIPDSKNVKAIAEQIKKELPYVTVKSGRYPYKILA